MVSEIGATLVELDELLKQADVISVHVPSTPQTQKMFNAEKFSRMKPGVLFINTSRGEVVDEEALIAALRDKKDRRARKRWMFARLSRLRHRL